MNEQGTSEQGTAIDKFLAALRSIGVRRRTDDRWVAGVCSGLAERLSVDPVILRAALILLSLLGIGITVYLLAWALLPNDRDEIVGQRALRDGDGGSILLSLVAALSLFAGPAFSGSWWGGHAGWGFPWGVALTGLLIWWLVKRPGSNPDADRRVAAIQRGTAGTSTPAFGPVSPQTGAVQRTQGLTPSRVLPQGQDSQQVRVAAPTQVTPKRLRRRSGGPLMAVLALGLALLTCGSLLWAGEAFGWTGNHAAIAFAGALAAIGLLLVVLGLAGRQAGFVAFLALVLAVIAWVNTAVPAGIQFAGPLGDAGWTPSSVAAPASYHLGVGNGILDLKGLPTGGSSTTTLTTTIAATVGIGDLKVMVPPGLTVKVVARVKLGEILLPTDPGGNGTGGSDMSRSILLGAGPAGVVVNAGVGIGQLTVVKE